MSSLPVTGRAKLPIGTGHCQEPHYSFCFNPLMWIQVAISAPRLWHDKWLMQGLHPDPGSGRGFCCSSSASHPTAAHRPPGSLLWVLRVGKSYFKALCYFQFLACPSTAKGSPPERRTLLGSLFPAQLSPGGTEASTTAWPLRRRRTHAPPDSCSHWLLPVANPRDRRRRAPPPAPPPRAPAAPALRRVPAGAGRAGLPAVARPPAPPTAACARRSALGARCPGGRRPQGGSAALLVSWPGSARGARGGRSPRIPPAKVLMNIDPPGPGALPGLLAAPLRFRSSSGRVVRFDGVSLCPRLRESGFGACN